MMPFRKNLRNFTAGALVGLAAIVMPNKADAGYVTFSPTQTGTVSDPISGLGGTNTDYLLTNPGGTVTLDRNFTGNNQEQFAFSNPSLAQDAASYNDHKMFQLGTDGGIRKVDLSDGSLVAINGQAGINAGTSSFGIGYDSVSNSIGIGNFNPNTSTMTFSQYNLGTGDLNPLTSFTFDTSKYGTPTGLDFVDYNGHLRMLVSTRDAREGFGLNNFVLDMNASTGSIDQYFTTPGSGNKLRDILYEDGRIMLAYQIGGNGFVAVGEYNVYGSCGSYDFTGDGFIDLTDFAHFAQFWLIDYGIEDLHLFLGHWLQECSLSEPLM